MSSVEYKTPSVKALLSLSSFIYLVNAADALATRVIHAGLIGPLFVGIIYGPQAANILPAALQSTLISIGYIGLLLIVFEAGLATNLTLLFDNLYISFAAALTGIFLPIAFSLLFLHFGYGYPPLESFAAGAALCSTSLGTTLSLLDPSLRQTRVGSVLISAALIDDIAGLVIAAIISQLSLSGVQNISWQIIVRPILVSVAFALGTPLSAFLMRRVLEKARGASAKFNAIMNNGNIQLFIIVFILSGFVAGAQYAGTSELFGAYLAGILLSYAIAPLSDMEPHEIIETHVKNLTPLSTFEAYITPTLSTIFSPLFFASIGSALPIHSLGSVDGSHSVVWKGIIYSLLMIVTKLTVGVWIIIWPENGCLCRKRLAGLKERKGSRLGSRAQTAQTAISVKAPSSKPLSDAPLSASLATQAINHKNPPTMSRIRSALLLGIAMVARGEIALIVAELARPLLESSNSGVEPFAVVIWAILITTVGGAMGVGLLLRSVRP